MQAEGRNASQIHVTDLGTETERRVMKTGGLARHGFGKLCPTVRVYWAVEVASVVDAAGWMMTVRVEVDPVGEREGNST